MSIALYVALDGSYANGTDVSDYLVDGSVRLERTINQRARLSFTLRGPTSAFGSIIRSGKSLDFQQPTSTTVFLGTIEDVRREFVVEAPGHDYVELTCDAVDLSARFDRRLIARTWDTVTVGTILDNLFTDALTAEDFTEGTIDAAVHNYTIDRLECVYRPVRWVLDEIAKLTGCSVIVNTNRTIDLRTRTAVAASWDVYENFCATNNDFETSADGVAPSGWTAWGAPTTRETDTDQHWEGDKSYKHTGGASTGSYQLIADATLIDQAPYIATVWCRCTSTAGGTTGVQLAVDRGDSQITRTMATANSSWTRLSVSFTYQAQAGGAYIYLGGDGTAWFDSAMCFVSPYPAIRNVSVRAHRTDYRNKQYLIFDVTEAANRTESIKGDSTLTQFPTTYPTASLPVLTVGGGARQVWRRGSTNLYGAASTAGLGFINQPGGFNITVESDDAGDTMNCTIYSKASGSDTVSTGTLALQGLTPVAFGPYDKVLAFVLANPPAGTITVKNVNTGLTICTFTDDEYGRVGITINAAHMPPLAYADAATTKYVGVVDDAANCWGKALSGTTTVTLDHPSETVAATISYALIGDVEVARTVQFRTNYEFSWQEGANDITQQSDLGAVALTSAQTLVVVYRGMYPAVVTSTDATEVSARDADEGGTGQYEDVERLNQPTLVVDAQEVADELIDQYCADGATSYFPRYALTYETPTTGLKPGDAQTVTIEQFAVRNVLFLIERVILRDEPLSETSEWRYIWTIEGTSTPFIGTWEAYWRRIGVDRQSDDKRERFSSVNNLIVS